MIAEVLAVFCATWPAALPRQIDRAATQAGAPVELVAAVVGAESTCNRRKVSRKGAVGYGQLLPGGSAAKHHTARELRRVGLNLRLTAEHVAKCLDMCGGDWDGATALYSGVPREKVDGVRRCVSTRWSRYVVDGTKRFAVLPEARRIER